MEPPKLLELPLPYDDNTDFSKQLIMEIRQEFLAAKTPCTFTVAHNFCLFVREAEFVEFHLENGIGEQLHGEWDGNGNGREFHIVRHQANGGTELREWVKENTAKIHGIGPGRIQVFGPTIGIIDAPKMGEKNGSRQKKCEVI